jgi:hypothetical protein
VTVAPEQEQPRAREGDAFSDAVTFAFGDEPAGLYGVARVGLSGGVASGLAIVFHSGKPVAVAVEGGVEVPDDPSWEEVSAAGIDTSIVEPLRRWTVSFASDEAAFDLEAEAVGALGELDDQSAAARLGGMAGYEQPARVRGTATVAGRRLEVDALGQRGHSWGSPDWERIEVARTLSAWLGEDLTVSLTAIRPAGGKDHARDAIAATILGRDPESGEPAAVSVADPRLSTTYDTAGHTRSAGLELWVDDDYPRRAAGEVVCGTTLDLGRLRLDAAFFRWRMEGRTGVGRYDVLRRA